MQFRDGLEIYHLMCPACGAMLGTTCVVENQERESVHPSRRLSIAERNRRKPQGSRRTEGSSANRGRLWSVVGVSGLGFAANPGDDVRLGRLTGGGERIGRLTVDEQRRTPRLRSSALELLASLA